MSRFILRSRAAFTIAEALTATFVALYVFLGALAVYMMVWSWWHEMAPRIEAERIARTALSSVIDGVADPTAGTFAVGSVTYSRRNGIAWAKEIDDIAAGESVQSLDFALEPDDGRVRTFYLGQDAATGQNAVYYRNSDGVASKIRPTLGITDLRFEKFQAGDGSYPRGVIKVTATVTKNITGTRQATYPITVTYSDVAYLRNME
jgi:hypothetical protein